MRQFENADSKLNQHRIRAPRPSCSNIRLAKWNKTERNTPGVPGLVVDNQALATTRTERPFHFAFDDPAEYSGVVRSNPSLHTRNHPRTPRCNTRPTVAACCTVLHRVARKILFTDNCNTRHRSQPISGSTGGGRRIRKSCYAYEFLSVP